jgi:hypothetical protein
MSEYKTRKQKTWANALAADHHKGAVLTVP